MSHCRIGPCYFVYATQRMAYIVASYSIYKTSFPYLEAESGAILSLVFTTQRGLVITTFTQPESKPELL